MMKKIPALDNKPDNAKPCGKTTMFLIFQIPTDVDEDLQINLKIHKSMLILCADSKSQRI
jgi:hypothetical protein